ncbi:MAG: hypothetical protein ABRQ39_14260 [Candidatus Eremiobacterota bacterium]
MIKNQQLLERFEEDFLKKEQLTLKEKFLILDSLYKEAVSLGIIPLKNHLDGIDVDIKLAGVINGVRKITKKDIKCT